MAYWFGRFSLFGLCFIKFLCWNVRWLLDAGFLALFKQISGLWCPWMSFGMLGASTSASWGTLGRSWDDPGTLEGTRKDPVRFRLGFYRFFVDLGDQFRKIFGYIWIEKHVFPYLFPGCFFSWFLGLNLGVWDWKTKHLAREVLQKSLFAASGFLMIPGFIFHVFRWPWDQFSWPLWDWRLASNLMTLQGDSGVTPDPGTFLVGGKLVHPRALVTTIPGSLKPDFRDPETETGNLETEKRVHRIHDTLETGLHRIPRSLVAPTRGAGGFEVIWTSQIQQLKEFGASWHFQSPWTNDN